MRIPQHRAPMPRRLPTWQPGVSTRPDAEDVLRSRRLTMSAFPGDIPCPRGPVPPRPYSRPRRRAGEEVLSSLRCRSRGRPRAPGSAIAICLSSPTQGIKHDEMTKCAVLHPDRDADWVVRPRHRGHMPTSSAYASRTRVCGVRRRRGALDDACGLLSHRHDSTTASEREASDLSKTEDQMSERLFSMSLSLRHRPPRQSTPRRWDRARSAGGRSASPPSRGDAVRGGRRRPHSPSRVRSPRGVCYRERRVAVRPSPSSLPQRVIAGPAPRCDDVSWAGRTTFRPKDEQRCHRVFLTHRPVRRLTGPPTGTASRHHRCPGSVTPPLRTGWRFLWLIVGGPHAA